MVMRQTVFLLASCAVLSVRIAWADCGSIPFKPWVSVFEPNQRAVIGFNGKEEILLLSTDLRASEPTKVLEVIPFPAKPEVKQGNVTVFYQLTEYINSVLFPRKGGGFGGGGGGMGAGGAVDAVPLPPAGKVAFHEKIGAQDITVTEVLDSKRFVAWVEDYLKKAGVDRPSIPGPLKRVVDEYLRDGFKWFAFNVVDLGEETVTKEAVQYRFATRFLYYPLRITRTEKGNTSIRLLIVSPDLVRMPDLGSSSARLEHRPVELKRNLLRSYDADLHDLLKYHRKTIVRTWEIKGPLSGFKRDVMTRAR